MVILLTQMITKEKQKARINQLIASDSEVKDILDVKSQYYLHYAANNIREFYVRYADENGLSFLQSQQRINSWDLYQWKKAVNEVYNKHWSKEANDRLKIAGFIASRNKGYMMIAISWLGIIALTEKQIPLISEKIVKDTSDEYSRLGSIFSNNVKKSSIKYTDESWKQRLWLDSDELGSKMQTVINSRLKRGITPESLGEILRETKAYNRKNIESIFNSAGYNAERILKTESARSIDYVADSFYRHNGVKMVNWVTEAGACKRCVELEEAGPYKIEEAPTIPDNSHPSCRCSKIPV